MWDNEMGVVCRPVMFFREAYQVNLAVVRLARLLGSKPGVFKDPLPRQRSIAVEIYTPIFSEIICF